jgi:riboflavin synthase
MFTGIIENMGEIRQVLSSGSNKTFWITSPLSQQLKVDQSLAHDGVCLTVEEIVGDQHRVTAIAETLAKTNLSTWQPGRKVNLERSLLLSSRLDGHFVQGHVDATGVCVDIVNREGSHEFEFEFPDEFSALVIEKGSVCINGISLTAWDVKKTKFKVGIIPYTFEHTNLKQLAIGEKVNIEFDMIGKYILRNIKY